MGEWQFGFFGETSQIHSLAVRAHIERPLAISMDEWNIRHLAPTEWGEPEPTADGGFSYPNTDTPIRTPRWRVNRHSPRTLADALFYAGVFHAIHRASQLPVPVAMANTVNLINANGLINVRPDGIVTTPSYHVWDLYQNHFGTIPVNVDVRCGSRWSRARLSSDQQLPDRSLRTMPTTVPDLDVSAALTTDRARLTVAVINRTRGDDIRTRLEFGRHTDLPRIATVRTLGAGEDDVFATNTLQDPQRITLGPAQRIELLDRSWTCPAHSISLLTFDLA